MLWVSAAALWTAGGYPTGRPIHPNMCSLNHRGVTGTRAPGAGPPASASSPAASGGDDLDGDAELDVRVQLHRHLVGSDRSDRLLEVETTPVELDAGLGRDRLDDVGSGDRTEQLAFGTGPRRNADHRRHERPGDDLGRLPVASVLQVARAAHGAGLRLDPGRRPQREAARK